MIRVSRIAILFLIFSIQGETVDLRSIYVFATENFIGMPTVHYVDILGTSKGTKVFERIYRTSKGRNISPSSPEASHWQSGAPTMGRP